MKAKRRKSRWEITHRDQRSRINWNIITKWICLWCQTNARKSAYRSSTFKVKGESTDRGHSRLNQMLISTLGKNSLFSVHVFSSSHVCYVCNANCIAYFIWIRLMQSIYWGQDGLVSTDLWSTSRECHSAIYHASCTRWKVTIEKSYRPNFIYVYSVWYSNEKEIHSSIY